MAQEPSAREEQGAYSPQRQQPTAEEQSARVVEQQDALAGAEPLVPPDEADQFKSRWDAIQTGFVDDPRRAVEEANDLVDEVTGRVVETFSRGRAALEEQWSRGDEVTTEELRVVLQRYRSFFDGLLRTGTAGT